MSRILDQPDIKGPAGEAWSCNLEQGLNRPKAVSDLAMCVLRTCDKLSVVCVHESGDEEKRFFDLMVFDDDPKEEAFDPRDIDNIVVKEWPQIAEPIDVNSEEEALQVFGGIVDDCIEGKLIPDITDQAKWQNSIEQRILQIKH